MSYNFSTLNDKDLEELSRDILSRKLGVDFQSFKMGADKGIDLRYATTNDENEIIVQVKHYLDSGISKLKSDLKKKEVNKVKALNPKRYILVTSLALNPQTKEEIKSIFYPFIISTNDIIGKNDLNNFLTNHQDIEESHFKLWLSSTNILKRILNNGTKGRSEFFDKKIKDRIKIFVPSKTHKKAVDILNKYNFILITGAPGIGKSTLANMLTYQLLANNFELVYVREIVEAEDLYIPNKKQVFYFDDFLGSITLDLKSSRNADSAIINFIERIKSDKQKRLILTCRTTILNQAKQESEKISDSKVEIANYEVKVQDYRDIDKAKILYNHIYFSNLSSDLKSIFFKDHFYWKVIKHKNYNPRIIEFFTDIDRLQPSIEYDKEVIAFLNDPSRIWEKTYSIQISQNARLFLSTLYSLGTKYIIHENTIQKAFDARLNYVVSYNNHVKVANSFNKVVKELVGGLIVRTHKTEKSYTSIEFRFLNPSIEDFLFHLFSKDLNEYFNILSSAIYFSQFKERISAKQDDRRKKIYFGETENRAKLLKLFNSRIPYLVGNGASKDINSVLVLIRLFQWSNIEKDITEIMNKLDTRNLNWDDRDNLIEIMNYIGENDLLNNFSFSIKELFLNFTKTMNNYWEIQSLSELISNFPIYADVIEKSKKSDLEYYNQMQLNIDNFWSEQIEYFMEQTQNINTILKKEDLIKTINRRKEEGRKFNELMRVEPSSIIDEFAIDLQVQLNKNILMNSQKSTQIKNLDENIAGRNDPLEINRLFNCEDNNEWEDDLPF
jgi:hypothetical protein